MYKTPVFTLFAKNTDIMYCILKTIYYICPTITGEYIGRRNRKIPKSKFGDSNDNQNFRR